MAIIATDKGTPRELIPAGNYVARCYKMLHLGTINDTYMGQPKVFNKVNIGWELPLEQRVFKQENGMQPCVISKEFNLSMNEKATLRKMLASWRGKDFTEEEAKAFDITKLIGKPCFINIIHKQSKDGTKMYEEIASVTPMPKGVECPAQINPSEIWDYENPNYDVFNKQPDFIKQKIQSSEEYKKLHAPETFNIQSSSDINSQPEDDLPF